MGRMERPPTFAVLGPGGVGGLLAALLIRAGSSVVVLAGDDTARALRSGGLRLESSRFGDFDVPVRTATRLSSQVDACLVTVKATQLRDAVARVPLQALGDDGLVIPFLNGLDHVTLLREVYGEARVVPATIRIETARIRTGLIRHTSPFAVVELAGAPGNRPRVDAIAAAIAATGVDVRVRDDELKMLWSKFMVLAPMALLTTHERGNVGAVRDRRREEYVAMLGELTAVAAAEGVSIDSAAILDLFDSMPASMSTSMQRDDAVGLPLELDALGLAVLRRAEARGIEVPVTRRIVGELEARTSRPA